MIALTALAPFLLALVSGEVTTSPFAALLPRNGRFPAPPAPPLRFPALPSHKNPLAEQPAPVHLEENAPSSLLDLALRPGDRDRTKIKGSTVVEWGVLSSEFVVRAPEAGKDAPFERGDWSTEEQVRINMFGPLGVWGQVEMVGQYAADSDMRVVGKGGVVCKVPVGPSTQVEVMGGPKVKYVDVLRPEKKADPNLLLELQCRWPIYGPLGFEYLGEALPPATPAERPRVNSDVGLVLPLTGGRLKVGARHRWDGQTSEVRPGMNALDFYVGLEIARELRLR